MCFCRHRATLLLLVLCVPTLMSAHLVYSSLLLYGVGFYWNRVYGLTGMQDITWLVALALVLSEPRSVVSE